MNTDDPHLKCHLRSQIILHICPHHHVVVLNLRCRRSCHNANENLRNYDTPSVVFYCGNGTKDRSIGVTDLPCVVGGQNMQIKMHVVPGEVPCLLSKSWLKENGAVLNTSSEELLLTKKQITAPMSEAPSGHFELDLCSREKDFGEGRTGTLRPSSTLDRSKDLRVSPSTPSRALVTCWKIMTPRCSLFLQNNIL